jgi:hypothetical protein
LCARHKLHGVQKVGHRKERERERGVIPAYFPTKADMLKLFQGWILDKE